MGVDTRDGKIENAYGSWNRFELLDRSHSIGEFVRETVSVFGRYDDLVGLNLKTGDPASRIGVAGALGNFCIETAEITRQSGEDGICTMNLVKVPSRSSPYHFSMQIGLEAVQKRLITHPRFASSSDAMTYIRWWELTPEGVRTRWKDGKPEFWYYGIGENGEVLDDPLQITDADAIKYCEAITAGIDSYQVYLPVISQTSDYLVLPGVSVDDDTKEVSGKLTPRNGDDIGTYCEPPVQIDGFTDGNWFKSEDKFSQNSNGTWTRTETWTYTNDLRFEWIYEDRAATKVVQKSGGGK